MSDAISAPGIGLVVVVLIPIIRLVVRGRLVERPPLVLVNSFIFCLFAICLFSASCMLIVLGLRALPLPIGHIPPLLFLQDDEGWQDVPDPPAVVFPATCMAIRRSVPGLK